MNAQGAPASDTRAIAEYIDAEVCCRLRAGHDLSRTRGVSQVLLDAMAASVGIQGHTVLDVGCGTGGLCIQLLRRGAAHTTGLDLSPQAVAEARRSSRRHGLQAKTTFQVADGAVAELATADLVVLDKVYCCYFDPTTLLANTLTAARSTYAIVLPPSRGLRGSAARALTRIENLWHRLRRRDFRAYVHDIRHLDAAVRSAGFQLVAVQFHWLWELRIYARNGHVRKTDVMAGSHTVGSQIDGRPIRRAVGPRSQMDGSRTLDVCQLIRVVGRSADEAALRPEAREMASEVNVARGNDSYRASSYGRSASETGSPLTTAMHPGTVVASRRCPEHTTWRSARADTPER